MQSDDACYCLSTLTSAEIEIISEMLFTSYCRTEQTCVAMVYSAVI